MSLLESVAKRLGYQPVDQKDPVFKEARLKKSSRMDQKHLLRHISVQTIFDVGAYDGCMAVSFHKTFPKAKIYSFEPSPDAFEKLKAISDIHPYQLALSDEPGMATFHLNKAGMTNSLLGMHKEAARWCGAGKGFKEEQTIDVAVSTIDGFCMEHKIDRINLLKIDTQGADLQVLKGADQMLKDGKIDVIFAEFNTFAHYESQATLHEILGYMVEREYEVFDIYPAAYSKGGVLLFGDILFFRNP